MLDAYWQSQALGAKGQQRRENDLPMGQGCSLQGPLTFFFLPPADTLLGALATGFFSGVKSWEGMDILELGKASLWLRELHPTTLSSNPHAQTLTARSEGTFRIYPRVASGG